MGDWTLSFKSSVSHPNPDSRAQFDPIPCSATVTERGDIEVDFTIQRGKPEELRLTLSIDDLKVLLLDMATKMPRASELFAECTKNAVEADRELLTELSRLEETRHQIEIANERRGYCPDWAKKLAAYFAK